MDIDPRLRGEQPSPRTPYPPPPQYPASADPSRSSIPSQYQPLHDGPPQHSMYPPPHTPQSTGNPIGGDSQGGNSNGGTPSGDANDPKRPRACEACRGLKVRCEPDLNNPDGPCKRCTKAGRNCIVTVPSRKRQKKTDSRVAELEKKIDALTQSLQASKNGHIDPETSPYQQVTHGAYGPPSRENSEHHVGSAEWVPPLARYEEDPRRPPPPPMVMAGQKRKHSDGVRESPYPPLSDKVTPDTTDDGTPLASYFYKPGASQSRSANETARGYMPSEYTDVIDRGIVTPETATAMFDRYVNELAPHMPAVVFPLGTTAAEIRKTRPILFLAILSAASGTNHPEVQRILTKEITQIFADRIISHGEKTLELIQALQVSTLWYWPPGK
jgi:hypothetical protein